MWWLSFCIAGVKTDYTASSFQHLTDLCKFTTVINWLNNVTTQRIDDLTQDRHRHRRHTWKFDIVGLVVVTYRPYTLHTVKSHRGKNVITNWRSYRPQLAHLISALAKTPTQTNRKSLHAIYECRLPISRQAILSILLVAFTRHHWAVHGKRVSGYIAQQFQCCMS